MKLRALPPLICAAAVMAFAAPTAMAQAPPPAPAAEGGGKLVLEWGKFEKANRRFAKVLRRSGRMGAVIREVNRRYALPEDLSVAISDQLDVGPAYFPFEFEGKKSKMIHIPGSFLTLEAKILRQKLRGIRGLKPRRMMVFATEFVLAHEIGHLLVDQLDIPITGKEEDAVDGFAAYLLADEKRFGARSPIAAAIVFDGLDDPRRKLTVDDYADEHSLSQQRVYQFLCWVYGSDRKRFKGIVGRDGLPRKRAVRCGAEWKQLNSAWSRLLTPYERTTSEASSHRE